MRPILVATLVTILGGCQRHDYPSLNTLAIHVQHLDQLQYADAGAPRDDEFARLAWDACTDGFPELTHIAIKNIDDVVLRDTVAFECALMLEKGNASRDAARIAQLIGNNEERLMVTSKIRHSRRN